MKLPCLEHRRLRGNMIKYINTCMVTTMSHALVLRWLQQVTYEEIHVNSTRANSEPVSEEITPPSESSQAGTDYQSQLLQLHL